MVATGTGSVDNPMVLQFAANKYPTFTCNHDGRPSAPNVGQFIYEADTGDTRVWNGSRWKLVKADPDWVQQLITEAPTSGHIPGGSSQVLTNTIANPFESTDPFVIDVVANLSFATGQPGVDIWDQWEVRLLLAGTVLDKDRVKGNAVLAGYCDAKMVAEYRSSGSAVNVALQLANIGGNGYYQLFADTPTDPIFRVTANIRPG